MTLLCSVMCSIYFIPVWFPLPPTARVWGRPLRHNNSTSLEASMSSAGSSSSSSCSLLSSPSLSLSQGIPTWPACCSHVADNLNGVRQPSMGREVQTSKPGWTHLPQECYPNQYVLRTIICEGLPDASPGHTVTTLTLKGKLPHLLFYGPPGTGKTSTILAVARQLNGSGFGDLVLEVWLGLGDAGDQGCEGHGIHYLLFTAERL